MVKIDIKGVHKLNVKGRTYYYAWRGGPRLQGEPGSPEFFRNYHEAIENRRTPDRDRFRSLVTLYKGSDECAKLADSTKKNWAPWLDRIADYFGKLRIAQFDRPEKIRPVIRKWRNQYANRPRTADYGMQVLSRVLSYAVDPLGKIASNPCEGIKQLYSGDRSEIIWTDADIAQLKKTCPPEIRHAVDLAAHTGLRLGDLMRLSWSHVGDHAIVLATGKSKQRREAIIPLYGALREALAGNPEALDYHSHDQPPPSMDAQRLWQLIQQGKDSSRVGGQPLAFSRSSRNRCDTVLHCRAIGARDRRNYGLGGRARYSNHSPLRWPTSGDVGNHRAAG